MAALLGITFPDLVPLLDRARDLAFHHRSRSTYLIYLNTFRKCVLQLNAFRLSTRPPDR
jgi:hypothetical protein